MIPKICCTNHRIDGNDSDSIGDATFQYSISIFTKNWAASNDNPEAQSAINGSLGFILEYLDGQR